MLTSHISDWRRTRDKGSREALAQRKTGRPARAAEPAEIEKLKKENEKLTAELARTKAALEVVGKHTRSWNCSPRARTQTRSGTGNRRGIRRAGTAHLSETACGLLGKSRATLYRKNNPRPAAPGKREDTPRAPHPAALSEQERAHVLHVLDSDRSPTSPPPRRGRSCSMTLLPVQHPQYVPDPAAAGQDGGTAARRRPTRRGCVPS